MQRIATNQRGVKNSPPEGMNLVPGAREEPPVEKLRRITDISIPQEVGAIRHTRPPVETKISFLLFGTPGKYLKHGSRVPVVLGDFRADHLTVH